MQFLSTSELRNPDAWLAAQGDKAVVTNHGKPIALMLPVTSDDFEEVLEMVGRIEALRAVSRLQSQARRAGAHTMSVEQIDRVIAKTRAARRARKAPRARRS